eukprot:2650226-Rhodomonas_salina.2
MPPPCVSPGLLRALPLRHHPTLPPSAVFSTELSVRAFISAHESLHQYRPVRRSRRQPRTAHVGTREKKRDKGGLKLTWQHVRPRGQPPRSPARPAAAAPLPMPAPPLPRHTHTHTPRHEFSLPLSLSRSLTHKLPPFPFLSSPHPSLASSRS